MSVVDALAAVLDDVRSAGALFGRNVMSSPWAIRFADGAALTLVTMVRGDGWIVADDAPPVRIRRRDRAVVRGAGTFTVSGDPAASIPPSYVMHAPGVCTTPDGDVLDPDELCLGVRTCGTQLDGENVLVTGAYFLQGKVAERLLAALPRVLVVADEGQSATHLDLAETEIVRDAPGQQAVLDRLLDLLLLTTLRDWFAQDGVSPPSWYRAMSDPVVGSALRAIHARPDRAWTVEDLADEAQVSRAAFARRFTGLLGEPPIAYLTDWRLRVAADLLQRTDATVEAIARRVGYSSAYALSAAFKRRHGTRPTDYRALARPTDYRALARPA